jgi:hypothetical protein
MAIPHAKSGEMINLRPLGEALARTVTNTLVNGKILHAQPGRDLIVDDPVGHAGQNRHADNRKRFHGKILKQQ